ncbi:hypothetical protein, partial [Erwinia sp. S38]|uniref:hypothetical protein n=1 Tax=Erwinia sp. S38 TaxID=2769338 RepID=UPI001F196894
ERPSLTVGSYTELFTGSGHTDVFTPSPRTHPAPTGQTPNMQQLLNSPTQQLSNSATQQLSNSATHKKTPLAIKMTL